MQRTEKQLEASRLNGAKSRGPISIEGKHRSSQNALRHGRFARTFTLSEESAERFEAFLADLCNTHQPANLTEHNLVENMALALWRKYRYGCTEKFALDREVRNERALAVEQPSKADVICTAVCKLSDGHHTLKSIAQTIALVDREYYRALNMLNKMQDRRLRSPDGNASGAAAAPQSAPAEEPLSPDNTPQDTTPTEDTSPTDLMCLAPEEPTLGAGTNANSLHQDRKILQINDRPQVRSTEPEPLTKTAAAEFTDSEPDISDYRQLAA